MEQGNQLNWSIDDAERQQYIQKVAVKLGISYPDRTEKELYERAQGFEQKVFNKRYPTREQYVAELAGLLYKLENKQQQTPGQQTPGQPTPGQQHRDQTPPLNTQQVQTQTQPINGQHNIKQQQHIPIGNTGTATAPNNQQANYLAANQRPMAAQSPTNSSFTPASPANFTPTPTSGPMTMPSNQGNAPMTTQTQTQTQTQIKTPLTQQQITQIFNQKKARLDSIESNPQFKAEADKLRQELTSLQQYTAKMAAQSPITQQHPAAANRPSLPGTSPANIVGSPLPAPPSNLKNPPQPTSTPVGKSAPPASPFATHPPLPTNPLSVPAKPMAQGGAGAGPGGAGGVGTGGLVSGGPPRPPVAPELEQKYWDLLKRLKSMTRIIEPYIPQQQDRNRLSDTMQRIKQSSQETGSTFKMEELESLDKTLHQFFETKIATEEFFMKRIIDTLKNIPYESLIFIERDLLSTLERSKRFTPDNIVNRSGGICSRTQLWFKNPILNNPFIDAPSSDNITPKRKQQQQQQSQSSTTTTNTTSTTDSTLQVDASKRQRLGDDSNNDTSLSYLTSFMTDLIKLTNNDNTMVPAKRIDNETIVISELFRSDSNKNLYVHFQPSIITPAWSGSRHNAPLCIKQVPAIQISTDSELYYIQPLCRCSCNSAVDIINMYKQASSRGDCIKRELLAIEQRKQYSSKVRMNEHDSSLELHFTFTTHSKRPTITLIVIVPDDYPSQPVNFMLPLEYELSPFLTDIMKTMYKEWHNMVYNMHANNVAMDGSTKYNGNIVETLDLFDQVIERIVNKQ
ncbi:hypothetical protein SAMD00019534_044660 [Acytostelium subglobosum LB1]|uniref:hypothetical protein n=1 Tax=Acytostelium subglobosum LB1 TaxID=1410327 RepID=UPI000644B6BE|nr:hypothetical protein SAMD00019534_044660 [Acytostelium subglobosum LB1]GAM21291.1 hypothetical protein SAMD00019534_044660 [Acytostelium subglobosum LB1]|eukprot:XP_012755410.1 hypothetical protein SAMD00019534_044660 [Acytostelium subglobosum LB1]